MRPRWSQLTELALLSDSKVYDAAPQLTADPEAARRRGDSDED